jgi:hypothetical protein
VHGDARHPCPLETVSIDVVVDVRPAALPIARLHEDGVQCAVNRHIPVVVSGAVAANPFGPWTTAECSVAEVVEAAVQEVLASRVGR